MKIDFPIETANYIEYCTVCHSPNTVTREKIHGNSYYKCSSCQATEAQAIIIDPKIKHWLDSDKEYCHASVGLCLFNDNDQFLMFKLNKFPFGWTIPAGHVDSGESPIDAVKREAKEETGLEINQLSHTSTLTIDKDGCRRGSDRHKWDIYTARTASSDEVVIDSNEGSEYEWISVEDALKRKNCFAIDYILKTLTGKLMKATKDF